MRVVDQALVGPVGRDRKATGGLIGGDPHLTIWVGETGIDADLLASQKVVEYPVPFATYTSTVGDDDNMRLDGRKVRRSVAFYLIYVGESVDQAKWAGERLRLKLQRHRLTIPGYRSWPIALQLGGSERIRRDDNTMRPDGSPLYYGIDSYAVSINLTETGVTLP